MKKQLFIWSNWGLPFQVTEIILEQKLFIDCWMVQHKFLLEQVT